MEYRGDSEAYDLHNWVAADVRGYVLLDPANREPLDPTTPHRWVASHPHLMRGFDFLDNARAALKIDLGLAPHESSADLGPRRQFEQNVAAADAYGFEGIGWNRALFTAAIAAYRQNPHTEPVYDNSFKQRTWRAAARAAGTHSFGYDIERSDHPLDALLMEISADAAPWKGSPAHAIGIAAVAAMREWYMVGKTGYELSLAFPRPSPQEPISLYMTVGSAHRDLVRKFGLFGIPVVPAYLSDKPQDTVQVLEKVLRNGRIDAEMFAADAAPLPTPKTSAFLGRVFPRRKRTR